MFFGPDGTVYPSGNGPTTDPNQGNGSSNGSNSNDQTGGFASGDGGTAVTGSSVADALNKSTAGPAQYTVKTGDTLTEIAAAHGMSVGRLEQLNPQIKNPDMIFPGQSIKLGDSSNNTGGFPSGNGSGGTSAAAGGVGPGGVAGPGPAPVSPDVQPAQRANNTGGIGDIRNRLGGAQTGVTTPEAEQFGGGAAFPTSSTYPPVEQSVNQEFNQSSGGRLRNIGNKLKGWGSFGSKPPADPAQNAMYMDMDHNTNPFEIKDKGHGGPQPQ